MEHLHRCLHGETREEETDTNNLQKVVDILQAVFQYRVLKNNTTWHTVVFVPKGDIGDFQRVGLFEVIWKSFNGLLN